jgi:hypothetical protein
MPKLFALILLAAGLVSCKPSAEKDRDPDPVRNNTLQAIPEETHKKEPLKSNFEESFQDFLLAIHNQDLAAFNQFIDKEKGLWIIENPGAVPKLTQVKNIGRFNRKFQGSAFFSIHNKLEDCSLQEVDTLPNIDCNGKTGNKAGYEEKGCFVTSASAFRKAGIYRYADLTQKQLSEIEASLPFVSKTVLHTQSAYKFHFGYIRGKWKILFIDLMIPCSA